MAKRKLKPLGRLNARERRIRKEAHYSGMTCGIVYAVAEREAGTSSKDIFDAAGITLVECRKLRVEPYDVERAMNAFKDEDNGE